MDLKSYFYSLAPAEREQFALRAGTTLGHLRNCAYGYRVANPILASAIERLSHQKVTRRDLRPTDWRQVWPELDAARGGKKAKTV